MPRALKTCSTSGCPELVEGSRCDEHNRAADRARGTPAQRGYDATWVKRRRRFLSRPENLFCPCGAQATVADHYPDSRRDLVAMGVSDPDADHRLRSLCARCHSRETAANPSQRGGWNAR